MLEIREIRRSRGVVGVETEASKFVRHSSLENNNKVYFNKKTFTESSSADEIDRFFHGEIFV